jgi:hypothetical protein
MHNMPGAKSRWLYPTLFVVILLALAVWTGLFSPLDVLPGLPRSNEQARESFDEAFWPGLYSGLISGAVTGVLIGLLVGGSLLVAEQRLESHRQHREQRVAISRFRETIRQFAWQKATPQFVPQDPIDTVSIGVRLIIEEYRDKPVAIWTKEAGDADGFFGLLNQLVIAYNDFLRHASGFKFFLELEARKFMYGKGMPSAENDRDVARYVLAKILNRDEPTAILLIASFLSAQDLQEGYEAIRQAERFGQISETYLDAWNQLQDAQTKLQDFFVRVQPN